MSALSTKPHRRLYLEIFLEPNGDPRPQDNGAIVEHNTYLTVVLRSSYTIGAYNPVIFTNSPPPGDRSPFNSKKFHPVPCAPFTTKTDWRTTISCVQPGAFALCLRLRPSAHEEHFCKRLYFVVMPSLRIADRPIRLAALTGITVLSQRLGPISRWPAIFSRLSALGYTMVHFTPLHVLGDSNSAYAIADQSRLAPYLFEDSKTASQSPEAGLTAAIRSIEWDYKMLPIIDLVWNHTASNSQWIREHPEATYNLRNSPHLQPAFELDRAIVQLSIDLQALRYPHITLPITTPNQVDQVVALLRDKIIPGLCLWEYHVLDVERALAEYEAAVTSLPVIPAPSYMYYRRETELLLNEAIYRRNPGKRHSLCVDVNWMVKLFARPGARPGTPDLERSLKEARDALDRINLPLYERLNAQIEEALTNIRNRMLYLRVESHGPGLREVSEAVPVVEPYFVRLDLTDGTSTWAASNGWVYSNGSLRDIASAPDTVYISRRLIVWRDLIKLRYGKRPEDSPFLWDHMLAYTREAARIFAGFRLDNLHNTPIHVAREMLDAARAIRPNLLILAELFTGDQMADRLFVARLGLHVLIRESVHARSASHLSEQAANHTYAARPHSFVGSFEQLFWKPASAATPPPPVIVPRQESRAVSPGDDGLRLHGEYSDSGDGDENLEVATSHEVVQAAQAIYFDCTHDNETLFQRSLPHQILPNVVSVWMTPMAVASTYGVDDLVAMNPEIHDRSPYPEMWGLGGLAPVREALNGLHQELEHGGFTELHLETRKDIVLMMRHNPTTHDAVIAYIYTAFHSLSWGVPGSDCYENTEPGASFECEGSIEDVILCGRIVYDDTTTTSTLDVSEKSASGRYEDWTAGGAILDRMKDPAAACRPLPIREALMDEALGTIVQFRLSNSTTQRSSTIRFQAGFVPGTVLIIRIRQSDAERAAAAALQAVNAFAVTSPLRLLVENITPVDASYLLYFSDEEERQCSHGSRGVYEVPGMGPLIYAGIAGFRRPLAEIRRTNDLSHPLVVNLRQGNWAMMYCADRLRSGPALLMRLGDWLTEIFSYVQQLPRYLVPSHFERIITRLDAAVCHHLTRNVPRDHVDLCISWMNRRDPLIDALTMVGVQLVAELPNTPVLGLDVLGPSPQIPPILASLSAGLPHFATGIWRCWGRDTFISFRGLLLLPGRFQEARALLVGFAANLRHGLIPNLLDSSRRAARYNSRDATWWFMEALQAYCRMSPEGHQILLTASVPRLHRAWTDDDEKPPYNMATMAEIVQEIMARHAAGIHFRERRAGRDIDAVMKDGGFNIDIELDPKTGFIYGGNDDNCGTWMDKMGSSDVAGNRGVPASPRDGAAVEIVALLKSATRWLASMQDKKGPAAVASPLPLSADHVLQITAATSPSSTPPALLRQPLSRLPSFDAATLAMFEGTSFGPTARDAKEAADPAHPEDHENDAASPQPMWPAHALPRASPMSAVSPATPIIADLHKLPRLASFGPRPETVAVFPSRRLFERRRETPPAIIFPYTGVRIGESSVSLSYATWDNLIQDNFERAFYIPQTPEADANYNVESSLVNRRGIYRDTVGSTRRYTDYQLRPNICVAMVVAPELFDPAHAVEALAIVERNLLGPVGMCTLDPADKQYHPNYHADASRSSTDYFTAGGFNYHLGPEWVWPFGYFIRARLQFRAASEAKWLPFRLKQLLEPHREAIEKSPWEGLVELTNANGATCSSSCRTQAWSAATILEAHFDLVHYDLEYGVKD